MLLPTVVLRDEPGYALVCAVFSLIGFACVILGNQRICWEEDSFVFYNFLNIPRRFSYGDIRFLQGRGDRDIRIYVEDRILDLGKEHRNRDVFLDHARSRYRMAHGGASIPRTPPEDLKLDFFLGHVENPTDYLISMAVMLVVSFTAVGCLIFRNVTAEPAHLEDLQFITANIDRSIPVKDNLLLKIDGKEYWLWGYRETMADQSPAVIPQYLCTVGYRTEHLRRWGNVRTVQYLATPQGQVITSPEDILRHEHRYDAFFHILFSSIALLVLAQSICSIAVGRHPEKYSPKLRKLLFRDGSLHLEVLSPEE